VVGLSLFLVLVVGIVVWLSRQDATYHAPLDGRPPPGVNEAAATSLAENYVGFPIDA